MVDFVAIPAIVVICWFVGFCIKTLGTSELADRLIPVVCGVVGTILAILIYVFNPSMIPATDIFSTIAIGIVSGLSATGANEAVKQIRGV